MPSFDITTGVDLQEVDNAINQATKEIGQRYDFKDAKVATVEFDRKAGTIALHADHDMRMRAMWDVVQSKLIRRGVSVKNVDAGEPIPAGGDTLKRTITLKQALDIETSKKISAFIKAAKFKKVQPSIQGDEVRVSAPDKDELQAVIAALRAEEWDVELKFGNFRER
ncbi:MAG: YajQ family cyclic di-GMP-binding protein [Gemmatimonadaceae bacterium]|nr:YajQ family cyclic di-GMP-binding protein [Gemmatimonadaceae bacterium]